MKKTVAEGDGLRVAVCHYRAGERHPTHTDLHSRISFVLRGGYREETKSQTATIREGTVLLKSRRAKHEDEFSETILVALEFLQDDPFEAAAPEGWTPREDAFALRHATAILDAALRSNVRTARIAATDLVASADFAECSRASAPPWLTRLRDELDEASLAAVCVATRARTAGVHPVYASRLFRRHFGVSVTEHARAQTLRRAFSWLGQRHTPLADTALGAGFYDQSHMNRMFRQLIGKTPGEVRTLIAAVV